MIRTAIVLLLLCAATASAAPPNDRCSNATPIQPGVYEGETCSASRDGSTSCAAGANAGDVWFQYTPVADEDLVAATFESNYDSVLSVHSGCPGTPSNQLACSDDCGNLGACVSFHATGGTTYWIRVSGFQNNEGRFRLILARDGGISGHVRDSSGGAPLKNVQVYVYIRDTLEFVRTVATDSSGFFLFTGLPPGDYIVRTINSDRYVDELFDNHTCEGLTCNPAVADAVTVAAGQIRAGTDFALDRGGIITGTVTDAITQLPIPGVEVHVHDPANNHITLGFTDAAGHYSSFDGLPAGKYLVLALNHARYVDELYNDVPCPAGVCAVSGGSQVSVSSGQTVPVDLALSPGGLISGTITDSGTGLPVPGVQVIVYDTQIRRITSGSSDSSGHYAVFDGLPTGSYYVRTSNSRNYIDELYADAACMAGFCSPAAGQLVPVVIGNPSTADFQLDPGGRISGTVRDSGTGLPLPGIPMDLLDASGRHLRYEFTDSSGLYSSTLGLVSGNYFIRSRNSAGFVDEIYNDTPCVASRCGVASGTPVPVTAGSAVPGVDFSLDPGGTVSGKVTALRNGLPLENVAVAAYDATGSLITYGISDSCGVYSTFTGVLPASYYLRTFNSIGLIDEIYRDIPCLNGFCSVLSGTPLDVTPGLKGIDFSLSDGVLLSDDFNDGLLTWIPRHGNWTEAGGTLNGAAAADGTAEIRAPLPWSPSGAYGCSGCIVEVRMRSDGGRVFVRAWNADRSNFVELQMNPDTGKWKLRQVVDGLVAARAHSIQSIQQGVIYSVRLQYDFKSIQVSIDGNAVMSMPARSVRSGNIAFRVKDGSAAFDSILVY